MATALEICAQYIRFRSFVMQSCKIHYGKIIAQLLRVMMETMRLAQHCTHSSCSTLASIIYLWLSVIKHGG